MNIERIVEYAFIHNEHNFFNAIEYRFVLFAIILELEKNNCIKFIRNENNDLILKVKNAGKNISIYERMVLDEFHKYNKSGEIELKKFFSDYLYKIIYYGGYRGKSETNWSIFNSRILEKIENKLKDEGKHNFNFKFFSLNDLIIFGSTIALFFLLSFIFAKINNEWIILISLIFGIVLSFFIIMKVVNKSFVTEKEKEEEKSIEETHEKLLKEYFTDLNIQYSNFYNWKENIIFETIVSNMKTGKDLIKNKEKYKEQNDYYNYLELYEELYRIIY